MPLLLFVCALRIKASTQTSERIFLAASAALILSVMAYELRWMIVPRIPGEREYALRELSNFWFLYWNGTLNAPATIAAAGLAAFAALFILRCADRPKPTTGSFAIVAGFAFFALVMSALPWLNDSFVAPQAQAYSRYNPIFASCLLGTVAMLVAAGITPRARWMHFPNIMIVMCLGVSQLVADVAMTARWRAYIADFRGRLASTTGLIAWDATTTTGNADRDATWQKMSVGWVLPILSIELAPNGRVRAIFDYKPSGVFRPIDPTKAAGLPKLAGVDYEQYLRSLPQHGESTSPLTNR